MMQSASVPRPGGPDAMIPDTDEVGGQIRWTTPSGRQYVTEPTRYPI
jgi:hypothetical protein